MGKPTARPTARRRRPTATAKKALGKVWDLVSSEKGQRVIEKVLSSEKGQRVIEKVLEGTIPFYASPEEHKEEENGHKEYEANAEADNDAETTSEQGEEVYGGEEEDRHIHEDGEHEEEEEEEEHEEHEANAEADEDTEATSEQGEEEQEDEGEQEE